ncbi:hypothetical protein Y1Q_0003865 [Alligator mississippiensis]|uniref:Uncharacterized protein n=1 Tax=Alligator mississippiensis TaxID=8496 RepID=A0A151MNS0_ALLMI|nr:hypothetical protein Y1Q_0003865 [Alligator mississippiensis]
MERRALSPTPPELPPPFPADAGSFMLTSNSHVTLLPKPYEANVHLHPAVLKEGGSSIQCLKLLNGTCKGERVN